MTVQTTAQRRHEARLEAKAAGLAVQAAEGVAGLYEVASASQPRIWHLVNTNMEPWRCDCAAGSRPTVWCCHKRRVRQATSEEGAMDQEQQEGTPAAPTTGRGVIQWTGAITDRDTALQSSGKLEGGSRVTFDIPERYSGAVGQLMNARRKALRITVEVL